ncbi:MAG: response regulator transcription factor [Bacteroidia bacterium]|nr:response regulator transcription factor [Bacteroidia bacterium]
MKLICNEKTNQEISDDLGISRNTVNTYRTRMIDKLGVKNSIGLVLYAIKKGIHRI